MMKQQKRKSSKIMVIEDEGEVLCRKEEVGNKFTLPLLRKHLYLDS
jgi:hypothetical protein